MLQKVMKQGRNGNVGEFRHMTTSHPLLALLKVSVSFSLVHALYAVRILSERASKQV